MKAVQVGWESQTGAWFSWLVPSPTWTRPKECVGQRGDVPEPQHGNLATLLLQHRQHGRPNSCAPGSLALTHSRTWP